MGKINVFLDDVRSCPDGFILVTDVDQCINMLNRHVVSKLSLDYDLEDKSRNGFFVVEYMVKNHIFAEEIIIHSANSAGSKLMYNYLSEAKKLHLIPVDTELSRRPLPII